MYMYIQLLHKMDTQCIEQIKIFKATHLYI